MKLTLFCWFVVFGMLSLVSSAPSVPFKYNFMVSLQGNGGHSCGGTLYNGNTIITAAHCANGLVDSNWSVVIHRHQFGDSQERYPVTQFIKHPNNSIPSVNDNDVAIVKLGQPVPFSSLIKLSSSCNPLEHIESGTVVAWGPTANDFSITQVDILSDTEFGYKSVAGVSTSNQFSAGGSGTANLTTCAEDIGSPIFVEEGGVPVLVGVISHGIGCALPRLTGTYTNLCQMKPWISENMK